MAHPQVVIGVDSSTQSTKALAVDTETGEVLGEGRAPHLVDSRDGGRQSDPDQWWDALNTAVAATGWADRAAALAVGGQQHGLVTLDAAGRPVRPALLWNDVRSAPQAAELVRDFGAHWWATELGSVPGPSFTAAKWAWLRATEPGNADRTAAVRLPHDHLTERLTGTATTDRGDASGTGWWTPDGYHAAVLDRIGLDPALLPAVTPAGTAAGHARPGGPLRPGTPVATGTGDNMAAALGLGLTPGTPVLSLGTSGTVYTVARNRPADPTGTVAGFADALDGWLPLACTLNCTLAVDRIATLLGRDRQAVEPGGSAVLLPYLDGERTPALPHASGLLHGLRHDTTPGQLLQAAYDGAAYSLLAALDDVLAVDGAEHADPEQPILLIGGGAQGPAWQDTVRRLSGRPVRLPAARELVALGAAAQAAALLTGERADAVARRWGTADGPLLPALERDDAALERIATTISQTAALQGDGAH
ncbi:MULTISPECIES: xylulokinase [Kitasatospora]|uniref:Xylulose kinase n=1 Tax=Kitasatospora setae (strain ATCC 33774 / DSM 43861 / JCM 3304 / KCC A-0304 / NBRC 14216 / KM-6054) TaxID=452652 RepID=E4N6R0_KITSK|nr:MULTISPECIES: xylulokinase [Kitasatospora]BAJ26891.1 putative xylulose kinase [Kitasatospora setae KM-6054]